MLLSSSYCLLLLRTDQLPFAGRMYTEFKKKSSRNFSSISFVLHQSLLLLTAAIDQSEPVFDDVSQ